MQRGLWAGRALDHAGACQERAALLCDVAAGKTAEQHLAEANLRLVVNIARKFQHRDVLLDDLVQEGYIGLQRAVVKYDPSRGFRFATLAV